MSYVDVEYGGGSGKRIARLQFTTSSTNNYPQVIGFEPTKIFATIGQNAYTDAGSQLFYDKEFDDGYFRNTGSRMQIKSDANGIREINSTGFVIGVPTTATRYWTVVAVE